MIIDEKKFKKEGFLIFESLLSERECQILKDEIVSNSKNNTKVLTSIDFHSELLTHPSIMEINNKLFGEKAFRFHHLHSASHVAGTPSLGWHHDYEQKPHVDREHLMVHMLIYLNGLNGTIGDLVVVPGSHTQVVHHKHYFNKGYDYFDEKLVINNLPAGSLVLIHSGLIHGRIAKPEGGDFPRFFVDMSFCASSSKWPSYLGRSDWRDVLKRLREANKAGYGDIFKEDFFEDSIYEIVKNRIYFGVVSRLAVLKRLYIKMKHGLR